MRIDSNKIRLLYASKSLTQKSLGERCGLHQQQISTVLTRGTCSPKTLNLIAAGLEVDPYELLKESEV